MHKESSFKPESEFLKQGFEGSKGLENYTLIKTCACSIKWQMKGSYGMGKHKYNA